MKPAELPFTVESRRVSTYAVIAAVAVVTLVAVYWTTAARMFVLWIQTQTYTHGILVLPIAAWLMWRDRAALSRVALTPAVLPFAGIAVASAAWVLAEVSNTDVVGQFALVFLVILTIVAVLGWRLAWEWSFPLAFLLFAVPAGDILLPFMIERTADFTVWAVSASGVPVYREANRFFIPTGSWSVVEACSGLRYLIASVFGGVLFAYLNCTSWKRRASIVAVSIVLPIVANWVRAYSIVMIGHLSSNELAGGVDHIIWGWLFFGVVIGLFFAVASRFAEPVVERSMQYRAVAPGSASPVATAATAAIAVAIAAAGPVYLALVNHGEPQRFTWQSIPAVSGWQSIDRPIGAWSPLYSGESARGTQYFRREGIDVGVNVYFYARQARGAELVGWQNRIADEDWNESRRAPVDIVWAGATVQTEVRLLAGPTEGIVVWQAYWVDGRIVTSPFVAKALLALGALRGDGGGASIIVHTRVKGDPAEAMAAVADMVKALPSTLEPVMNASTSRVR